MVNGMAAEKKLDILKARRRIDLSLNDIRIIVGCLGAVAYQGELDNESYLDADAQELQKKLEALYAKALKDLGADSNPRR